MTEVLALSLILGSALLIVARGIFIKGIEGDVEHEIGNE